MIAWLKGELADIEKSYVVLNVHGVGYQVYISPSHASQLPALGSEVEMVIHTDVKETDITLYGFRSTIDRKVFLFLKKVKGIGSRLAISILSAIETKKLLYAIATSDAEILVHVPGIGKKSAERIILELKEQVQTFVRESSLDESMSLKHEAALSEQILTESIRNDRRMVVDDASMALLALGFKEDDVRRAIASVMDENSGETGNDDPGEIVKKALSFIL
jgi:holliday junction DNA helicase RuvA